MPAIADLCREQGLWLHVDAAYGGAAALVPESALCWTGASWPDSLVVNPHKWLFTPMDCSVLFARDMNALRRAFSLVPDYLVTEGDVTNFMDYGVQLGRRFRALKLWMIFRAFGRTADGRPDTRTYPAGAVIRRVGGRRARLGAHGPRSPQRRLLPRASRPAWTTKPRWKRSMPA